MSVSTPNEAERPSLRHPMRMSTENRYGLVLLLLLVTYIVSVSVDSEIAAAIVVLVQLFTVWLAFTVSESRRSRSLVGLAIVLVLVAALIGGTLGYSVDGSSVVTGIVYTVNAILYLIAPVLIFVHLFRRSVVDLQTFLGAVAAYVMIGLMFAFSYRALGEFQSAAFFGANGDGAMSDDLFFSFITLTTTGYGNLVPAANPGQSLAVLEAVIGQLFLVTAVAKVVASWDPLAVRAAKAAARDAEAGGSGTPGA